VELSIDCTRCGGLQDARRQDAVVTPPPLLLVIIKRQGVHSKASHPIEIDEALDMQEHTGGQRARYKLQAVVCHQGADNAGHYYTLRRRRAGTWLCANDSTVRKCGREAIRWAHGDGAANGHTATMVLYQRQDEADPPPDPRQQDWRRTFQTRAAAVEETGHWIPDAPLALWLGYWNGEPDTRNHAVASMLRELGSTHLDHPTGQVAGTTMHRASTRKC
jgi:hypothetical protein